MTRIGRRAALAAWLGLLCASAAQASIPTLFYSPLEPPVDPGSIVVPLPPNVPHTLELVLNPGPVLNTSGSVCDTGNGDNTCGLYFEITVNGDLSIASNGFSAEIPGQVSDHVDGQTLRVAIVTTSSPLPPGPTRLGTLTVNSGPNGGNVQVSKLQTVDASLDLMDGAPRSLVYIPEPGAGLGLAAGGVALALLARRRAQREGVR